MTPKYVDSTKAISKSALILSLLSTALFLLFSFGPADTSLFDAGEELIVGPVLSLIALAIASLALLRTNTRNAWHYAAITGSTVVLVLWIGLNILFYLAYSNCPGGVC